MKRSTGVWTVLLLAGVAFLVFRAASGKMGKEYVRGVVVAPEGSDVQWTKYVSVPADERIGANGRPDPTVQLSWPRTIGVWVAAFFTLSILSFLWGDNLFYKLAESVVVGVSAAYAMVVGFWTGIVQNLFGKLVPELMRASVLPGIPEDVDREISYVIPLVLSVMLLWRLMPSGGWISRWPLAFFIGATAGIRLVAYLDADFVKQIQSTIIPLLVYTAEGGLDWRTSLKNMTIVVGVLACMVYFFFSIEHRGVVGGVARLGIWFLMITFGAGFGYTVMGRIALLSDRFEFLFRTWLAIN